jgi:dCMP deaminase
MWDERYIQMACLVASWSKDPDRQVGCVLTDEYNRVVATGYNGLPRGIDIDRLQVEDKLAITIHAELNALLAIKGQAVSAYVWPYFPCATCAAALAQHGVCRIISKRMPQNERWRFDLTEYICKEKEIELIELP